MGGGVVGFHGLCLPARKPLSGAGLAARTFAVGLFANGIRRERPAAAMPAAFARYSLCIESGLRPLPPREISAFDEENPIPLTNQRERVLRGRELNGERDFEF